MIPPRWESPGASSGCSWLRGCGPRIGSVPSRANTPSSNARAWHLGWQNPLFGHGYHRLLGTADPAIDRARTVRAAILAQQGGIHNLYLWWFQTIGVPGTLGYLAMWGIVLWALLRARDDPDIRLATISYVAVLGSIGFHTAHHDLPYLSIVVSLAVIAARETGRRASPPRVLT